MPSSSFFSNGYVTSTRFYMSRSLILISIWKRRASDFLEGPWTFMLAEGLPRGLAVWCLLGDLFIGETYLAAFGFMILVVTWIGGKLYLLLLLDDLFLDISGLKFGFDGTFTSDKLWLFWVSSVYTPYAFLRMRFY